MKTKVKGDNDRRSIRLEEGDKRRERKREMPKRGWTMVLGAKRWKEMTVTAVSRGGRGGWLGREK
ncbi:hypothetical protein QJS04_geneDACA011550 [Acorus gramineus]|uniref:Uncharacterized protein n=1 Tax=Acorus gramineus TaxID=55184 RepID=A0AAV9ACD5_ACOGR|nr:hypothetical protein QJS04_geneDACA011550 [Acorus gramineus]